MNKERTIQKIKDNIIEVIYRHTGNSGTVIIEYVDVCAEIIFNYFDKPESSNIHKEIADLQRCFVTQKQEKEELLENLGNLSLKINVMHSSLREFEKQKFEPLRTAFDSHVNVWAKNSIEMKERISHLENPSSATLPQRIHAFVDEIIQPVKDELYQVSQRVGDNVKIHETATDDLETDVMYMNKRMDDLEKILDDHIDCQESKDETIKELLQRTDVLDKQLQHEVSERKSVCKYLMERMGKPKFENQHEHPQLNCQHEWTADTENYQWLCCKCKSTIDSTKCNPQGNSGDFY